MYWIFRKYKIKKGERMNIYEFGSQAVKRLRVKQQIVDSLNITSSTTS